MPASFSRSGAGIRAPLFHIRHDSTEPRSTYRPGRPGNQFKPEVAPLDGEWVVVKHVNPAFIGTGLAVRPRSRGISELAVCGVSTGNSVETTVRHGGNLGFHVNLAEDACFTFARLDYDGRPRTAGEAHSLSLAHPRGEYCRIARTAEFLGTPDPLSPHSARFFRDASGVK